MTSREINQVYYNTTFKSMALNVNTCINISNVENKDVELHHPSHNLEYSLWNIDDISILIRCKSNGYCRGSDQKVDFQIIILYKIIFFLICNFIYFMCTNLDSYRRNKIKIRLSVGL
jgi:hypothetical protein